MIDELKRQLTGDEGRIAWAYPDSLGYLTIGIGTLIDKRKNGGLRDVEIDFIFNNRLYEKREELTRRVPWTKKLDDTRLGALLNMCFQLGVNGVLGFPRMLYCLDNADWQGAHDNALDSDWARTQTPARAKRIATQFLTGVWQYELAR